MPFKKPDSVFDTRQAAVEADRKASGRGSTTQIDSKIDGEIDRETDSNQGSHTDRYPSIETDSNTERHPPIETGSQIDRSTNRQASQGAGATILETPPSQSINLSSNLPIKKDGWTDGNPSALLDSERFEAEAKIMGKGEMRTSGLKIPVPFDDWMADLAHKNRKAKLTKQDILKRGLELVYLEVMLNDGEWKG